MHVWTERVLEEPSMGAVDPGDLPLGRTPKSITGEVAKGNASLLWEHIVNRSARSAMHISEINLQ